MIYPLPVLVPWVVHPLARWPPPLRYVLVDHLLVAAIIVGLMTWVVMPPFTRLVAGWLYR